MESFLKEGVMMKNFDHPHVLRLLGVSMNEGDFPMVILPYMANGDLRSYVKDKSRVSSCLLSSGQCYIVMHSEHIVYLCRYFIFFLTLLCIYRL